VASILRVDKGFDHSFFKGASCAFGVFDGFHAGHQFMLACAQETAAKNGGKSIALTFDIDPDEIFYPQRLRKLMGNDDRIEALASSGIEAVAVLPFTREFAALSPADFLTSTFNGFAPYALHVGSDFRFGAQAKGTVAELEAWGKAQGARICAHGLKTATGSPITSTRIRHLLAATDVERAQALLGRPYFIRAQVQPGRGEGGAFGFATANLKVEPLMQVLGEGVYAAYVDVCGVRYRAAVSVGVSPMFKDRTDATCEAHILDYEGDLYGKEIKVSFMHFLRPMMSFASQEELINTVMSNIAWVRENL
jgi:riboflavin kinase/FMN adenylyltransferase